MAVGSDWEIIRLSENRKTCSLLGIRKDAARQYKSKNFVFLFVLLSPFTIFK